MSILAFHKYYIIDEGVVSGSLLQSGQIQGKQQQTSLTLGEPRHFLGQSDTYGGIDSHLTKDSLHQFSCFFLWKAIFFLQVLLLYVLL